MIQTTHQHENNETHERALIQIANIAPEPAGTLWRRFAREVKAFRADGFAKSCCRKTGGRAVSIEHDAKGSPAAKPYLMTVHEWAHTLDILANRRYGSGPAACPYSYAYRDNLFGKTIQAEAKERLEQTAMALKKAFPVRKHDPEWLYAHGCINDWHYQFYSFYGHWAVKEPAYKKSMAYACLRKEISALPPMERLCAAELLEGALKGRLRCGFFPGQTYWKQEKHRTAEAFADLFAALLICPEAFAAAERYLPESVKIFWEILLKIEKHTQSG